jgi:hypothetical protein
MADKAKQKAFDLLTILSDKPTYESSTNSDSPPELSVLHQDLISLLSLLYAACTKIALVLNPASPAYSASAEPLNDALKHRSGLLHCLSFYTSSTSIYGETLGKEVSNEVRDVLDALCGLAEATLKILQAGKPKKGDKKVDAERFIRVGAVHDLVEKAKHLSKDNLSAVTKKWDQDLATMEDSLREVEEMLEEDEEEEDGWDELGLGGSETMSEAERDKTTHILEQLKRAIALHKRVRKTKLNVSGTDPTRLDELALQSNDLVTCIDDLVATVYTTNGDEEELERLLGVISRLEAIT